VNERQKGGIPFRLVLSENLALGMVADYLDVDKTTKVELLGPEHRHVGGLQRAYCGVQNAKNEVGDAIVRVEDPGYGDL
jgi:hypothetical protein